MDGTLVDSADDHWQAWRDTMAREGHPITHDQFLATFGQRNDSILRQWLGAQVTSRSRTSAKDFGSSNARRCRSSRAGSLSLTVFQIARIISCNESNTARCDYDQVSNSADANRAALDGASVALESKKRRSLASDVPML